MTDGLVAAISIILMLNPKPSTVPTTESKVNSIPSKTRTVSEAPAHKEEEVPHWEQRSLGFPSLGATTVEGFGQGSGGRYLSLTQHCNSLQLL